MESQLIWEVVDFPSLHAAIRPHCLTDLFLTKIVRIFLYLSRRLSKRSIVYKFYTRRIEINP